MRVRPLVTYISFTLASFAFTLGAVAQATTYGVRYPAMTCLAGEGCGFDTGSSFPTDGGSLTQVLVDYFVNNATSQPSVDLCNATRTTVSCSTLALGSGSAGGQQIAITDSTRLSFWGDDSKYLFLGFNYDDTNITFNGFKVSGN